ncbi:Metallo-dependent phosphatase-like protein [Rhizoctonia solani]|nr:Metallo-dependent phosphatase-like protein [Rhizoctonia solani]
MTSPLTIPILHFNDVYNMTRSAKKPENTRLTNNKGELHEDFDHVIQFARKIQDIQDSWAEDNRQGLLLFSGDLFSPSVESTLTEGRNMVHLMNELAPDACVPGNHEFDFKRERFNQLVESCNFPWVLSNAEEQTKKEEWVPLKYLHRHYVLDIVVKQQKLRIGIIGLMSEDTVSKIDVNASKTFKLLGMKERCMEIAAELRTEENCDLVIALTHALYAEDVELAKQVNCYTADTYNGLGKGKLEDTPGVDLILGGHDHVYFTGKGVELERTIGTPKETQDPLPADDGVLIIKSGTDFEELSECAIEVEDRHDGKVRKKVIKSVKVIRHCEPGSTDPPLDETTARKYRMPDVINRIFRNQVRTEMKKPVGQLPPEISPRVLTNEDQASRRGETVLGNWIADSMIRWYQNHRTSCMKALPNLIFITTGGSIRSGSEVDPKKVLQGELVQLSPFTTSLITITVTGKAIWETLELALQKSNIDPKHPTMHEAVGSFPVVGGITVEWNSNNEPGKRVCSVMLSSKEPVARDETEYNVLTHTYLSGGGDGLKPLANHKNPMDTEVPVYKALLQDISDISIRDAKKLLEQKPAPGVSAASKARDEDEAPSGLVSALGWGFLGFIAVAALDSLIEDLAKEDRPLLIPEKVMDQAVKITKETKLPVLSIAERVDGRMKDLALSKNV